MTPGTWLGLVLAGALGAPLRYLVDGAVGDRAGSGFPWGTLVVNVLGSLPAGFLAGLVLFHGLADTPKTVLAVGFCGAFTTFSTFSYETVSLIDQGAVHKAVRNVVGTAAASLAAAGLGLAVAAAL